MNQFMGVMTDPFIAGRGDPVGGGGSPNAFADEEALAYAARGKSRTKTEVTGKLGGGTSTRSFAPL